MLLYRGRGCCRIQCFITSASLFNAKYYDNIIHTHKRNVTLSIFHILGYLLLKQAMVVVKLQRVYMKLYIKKKKCGIYCICTHTYTIYICFGFPL